MLSPFGTLNGHLKYQEGSPDPSFRRSSKHAQSHHGVPFTPGQCLKHSNISVAVARGRHEEVYGSGNSRHRNRGGDIDTQREVVRVYRKLDKSRAQILVEEDLLARTVRHSNSSIHILVGKSNSQPFEGRTGFGGYR